MPKPSVALWRREADHERDGEAELVVRRRLADREPFGEVVQADSGRDEDRPSHLAGE